MTGAIQTINLTKTYGKNRGIRDVNLDIQPGEIFGFLGPNGAGKSTTLRTLAAMMRPTSGQCYILGIDPHADPVAAMRNVGNLPTEFSLDDRATGRELIRLFARIRGVADMNLAETLAKRIDADLDRPIRRLSRGNKQKIGIVQALFHRPPVVILDEPTGGLDPLVQEQVMEILKDAKANGQTILFSSHVLSEVERIADRIGIIREGELVAVDDPHVLTERATRHVQVRFTQALPSAVLTRLHNIPGIGGIHLDDGVLRLTLDGDVNAFLDVIASVPITSLDVERPSLEEIFLGFYGPAIEVDTP